MRKDTYYNQIKDLLIDNEIYQKVKDYSKERNKVNTYYEIGKLLAEAGKHYGENIIGKYSEKLIIEVGKKYNRSLLFRMRQFYLIFPNVAPSAQLSWSHYQEMLPLKNKNKINYYIKISTDQHLTRDQLRERIKSNDYERLPEETKLKLINNKEPSIQDNIKNPIIIKTAKEYEKISEKVLQQAIVDNISNFLKELGNGFSFIDNEYKIKLGNTYNYIDLLLYNIKFKCYVVIELKVTELKKEHIGQIQVYMNYIDRNVRDISDNRTIGIIISKRNNRFVVEYSTDSRITFREFLFEKVSPFATQSL